MNISWRWLQELVDLSSLGTPEKLAELLTSRGLEVEDVARGDRGLEKVVTAKILERAPHPQADRLSLCTVSLGRGEPLQIVCGAQNMKSGDLVALAQVGAELPNGMKIAESKIRGVASHGMLCSEVELGFAKESEGILILPAQTELGQPLAQALGRDDTILALKLTANRGDCLSHFGIARELASALGVKVKPLAVTTLDFASKGSPIAIELQAGEGAPQFAGVYLEGIRIGPSPAWVVRRLEALGSRSINNVVDASNLAMLELGHPTHAYDADKIEGGVIRVRSGVKGEILPLLDGTSVTLEGFELVIADAKKAVGLAGVMGGGNSEVGAGTKRIFLESAEFAPGPVRRAATKHQHRTDASHRFERGVDPEGPARAAARVARLITSFSPGAQIKTAALVQNPSRAKWTARKISVSPTYFPQFLGMEISADEAKRVLEGLECKVSGAATWEVEPPSYRLDLTIREDLAEEIARSVGYDRIPSTIPVLHSMPQSLASGAGEAPAAVSPVVASMAGLALLDRAKDGLKQLGLQEVLNYSFTSKAWLARFGAGLGASAVVINPLSEELEALVPSLLPGLIRTALANWNHHFGSEPLPLRFFELRPTFSAPGPVRSEGEMATNVLETWKLGFVLSGPKLASGLRAELGPVDFQDLRALLESLFALMGTRGTRILPLSEAKAATPLGRLLHPGQSVEILAGKDSIGVAGLLHPGMERDLKLRAPLWWGELDWAPIVKLSRGASEAEPFRGWSEFPPIERDFALVVAEGVTADKITQAALKAGRPLAKVAKIFDVYRGSQVAQGMTSIAVRVIFYEEGRSLQEAEAESASAKILEAWKKELNAELR